MYLNYLYSVALSYKNLIFQLTLSLSVSLILHLTTLPSLFLQGLNTYIHPDDVNPSKNQQSGPKVALRRPSDPGPNQGPNQGPNGPGAELRSRRKKPNKDKFEFDESKAQIFRLRLGDAQIQSRLFFDLYKQCFNCLVISCCCFLLQKYLALHVGDDCDDCGDHGVVKNGSLVPILIGLLGLFRVLISVFRVSVERSAFKRSDRQLGLVVGLLGFFVGLVICLRVYDGVVGFEFGSIDGFGRLCLAVLCGFVAGFSYMAAGKNARAFWVGTDQIKCGLSIVACGWFAQIVFYANYLLMGFNSLLWINPFGEMLVNRNIGSGKGSHGAGNVGGHGDRLIGNVGMAQADFLKFRLWCLLISGVLHVLALRLNVQTFLNEAVLSWYQRLHSSTTPDMDYSRAKVFLHNHYLCLAVVQFFAPAGLILLLLGLSQVDGGLPDSFQPVCGILPCSVFVREAALFLAWWVTFVWFLFTSVYLALYRRGILCIS